MHTSAASGGGAPQFFVDPKAGVVHLNRRRLQSGSGIKVPLRDGDALHVGATTMRFRTAVVSKSAAAAAAASPAPATTFTAAAGSLELVLKGAEVAASTPAPAPFPDQSLAQQRSFSKQVPGSPPVPDREEWTATAAAAQDAGSAAADDDSEEELEVYVACSGTGQQYTVMLRSEHEPARTVQKRLLRLHGAAVGSEKCQLWLEGAR